MDKKPDVEVKATDAAIEAKVVGGAGTAPTAGGTDSDSDTESTDSDAPRVAAGITPQLVVAQFVVEALTKMTPLGYAALRKLAAKDKIDKGNVKALTRGAYIDLLADIMEGYGKVLSTEGPGVAAFVPFIKAHITSRRLSGGILAELKKKKTVDDLLDHSDTGFHPEMMGRAWEVVVGAVLYWQNRSQSPLCVMSFHECFHTSFFMGTDPADLTVAERAFDLAESYEKVFDALVSGGRYEAM